MGGAQPPFLTTGAAQPALHLRLLFLRAGDVEVNPGPVCSGCTGTIRVGSHPIICTKCQRLFHEYCNGLTRDRQKSPQGYVCGACGSTNGSTIQPSQITRSQPNNTFFCFARGGGLLTYIKKGIPYSEVPAAQQGPLEKLHVTIPTTRRQHLTIANVYFPSVSSNYVQPMEDRQTWVDALEARGLSVICSDFNAHHV